MPSDRAQRYLAGLERRRAVPTADVEALLRDGGHPCFAPWLDFHDRYAGYVELWTNDWAIWGLCHETSHWWSARTVVLEEDAEVVCADTHPVHNYKLDQNGEFLGDQRAESFEIRVEQLAVATEVHNAASHRFPDADWNESPHREELLARMEPHAIAAASDRHHRYYLDETYLVIERLVPMPRTGKTRLAVWRHNLRY